jgi:hypothetical protein
MGHVQRLVECARRRHHAEVAGRDQLRCCIPSASARPTANQSAGNDRVPAVKPKGCVEQCIDHPGREQPSCLPNISAMIELSGGHSSACACSR